MGKRTLASDAKTQKHHQKQIDKYSIMKSYSENYRFDWLYTNFSYRVVDYVFDEQPYTLENEEVISAIEQISKEIEGVESPDYINYVDYLFDKFPDNLLLHSQQFLIYIMYNDLPKIERSLDVFKKKIKTKPILSAFQLLSYGRESDDEVDNSVDTKEILAIANECESYLLSTTVSVDRFLLIQLAICFSEEYAADLEKMYARLEMLLTFGYTVDDLSYTLMRIIKLRMAFISKYFLRTYVHKVEGIEVTEMPEDPEPKEIPPQLEVAINTFIDRIINQQFVIEEE